MLIDSGVAISVAVHGFQSDLGEREVVGIVWRRYGRASEDTSMCQLRGAGSEDRGVGGSACAAGEKLQQLFQTAVERHCKAGDCGWKETPVATEAGRSAGTSQARACGVFSERN